MTLAGIVVTLLGFVIALMSLPMTTSVNARLLIVLIGLAVSLLFTLFFIAWSLQVLRGDTLPGFDRDVATTFRDVSQGDHFRRDMMVLITFMGGVPAMFVLAFVGSTWQSVVPKSETAQFFRLSR